MSTSVKNNGEHLESGPEQPSKKFKKDHDEISKDEAGKNGEEASGGHVEKEQLQKQGDDKQPAAEASSAEEKKESATPGAETNDEDASHDREEEEIQKVIKEVQRCQQEICSLSIQEAFSSKLEQEYNEMRRPFIEKRDELIRKIPDFWVQAFVNHPTLTTILEKEDEQCLHYLSKLEVEEFADPKSGYKIKFHFEDNPYFENSILVKEFHLGSTGGAGDPASSSTPINWKNTEWAERLREQTTNKTKKDSARKRKSSGPAQTFFSWYLHYGDALGDQIAKILKEDLWLNPVQYYLFHDNDDEESLEDEDEDDYDEEDEEDESDDDKSIDLESADDEEADEEEEGDEDEGEEGDDDAEGEEEGSEGVQAVADEEGEGEGEEEEEDLGEPDEGDVEGEDDEEDPEAE